MRKFKVREGTQVAIGDQVFAGGDEFTVDETDQDALTQAKSALEWGWAEEIGPKSKAKTSKTAATDAA